MPGTALGPNDPCREHETHAEVVLNLKYIQIERTGDKVVLNLK
jgi:hypothetical protein